MENMKIELQNISKSYYSEAAVTQALRKINLTFDTGEFVAITGESGSGKSTLLRIIGGMDSFDEGEMFVEGEPTFQYSEEAWETYRRERIGYVFQDYSLIGHYTVLDNIVSGLLIMEQERSSGETGSFDNAVKTARKYLARVGLADYETHKASELSSGQKQRLSIARALAKDTGIILADEPTGNLDSDTGKQIVELLKELSADSLVIMVTHNFAQAEPYVTRKIRLHDGMIISDVHMNQEEVLPATPEEQEEVVPAAPAEQEKVVLTTPEKEKEVVLAVPAETDAKTSENIAPENTPAKTDVSQDNLSAKINTSAEETFEDEISFKEKFSHFRKEWFRQHHTSSFYSKLNRRTQKGRAILITSFLLIISVVSFLLIGEINLHGEDVFTKKYSQDAFYRQDPTRLVVAHEDGSAISDKDIETLESVAYVETVDSCDLANDINYYIENKRDYTYQYGKQTARTEGKKQVKFLNENHFMMSTDCISKDDLAAGELPESRLEVVMYSDDAQLIGSKILCYFTAPNIWGANEYYQCRITVSGILKEPTEQVYFTREFCHMLSLGAESKEYRLCHSINLLGDYQVKLKQFPVIADNLSKNNFRMSSKHFGQKSDCSGEALYRVQEFDEEGNPLGEPEEQTVEGRVNNYHEFTASFLEVSEELYRKYHPEDISYQASVYIVSYGKTDAVTRKLEKKGYSVVSTYRVSVTDYVEALANERLMIIGISALGLLILLLAEVLILRSLLKIRIKDYFVLKFIGMKLPVIRKINYHELTFYCIVAMILTVIIMWGVRLTGIEIISEMMWYFSFKAYLEFVLYNLALTFLTTAAFNHLLKRKM